MFVLPIATFTLHLHYSFILDLNFTFLCFKLIIVHYHTPKQTKINLKPRIKLNHNVHKRKYVMKLVFKGADHCTFLGICPPTLTLKPTFCPKWGVSVLNWNVIQSGCSVMIALWYLIFNASYASLFAMKLVNDNITSFFQTKYDSKALYQTLQTTCENELWKTVLG